MRYDDINNQDQEAAMQQRARTAMDRMVREIRMAGHRPTRSATSPPGAFLAANADSVQFILAGGDDSHAWQEAKAVTYGLFSREGIQFLGRKAAAGDVYQTVADHVQALRFTYYDSEGNILAAPVAARSQIRHIQVTLTLRTVNPEPGRGHRTITLDSYVTPKNLGW